MKVMSKVMAVIVLCVGMTQVATAKLNIQIIKTDPESRTKRWSYQIRTKQNKDATVKTTQLKTFLKDTKFSIDPNNFDTAVIIHKNRTAANPHLAVEIPFDPNLINELKKSGNAIALDKDARMSVDSITKINEIIKSITPTMRTIKVERVGDVKGTLTIKLFKRNDDGTAGQNYGLEKITGQSKDISIPANVPFSMKITGSGVNNTLSYPEQGSKAPDVLYLDDKGKVTAAPVKLLEF